MIILSKKPDPLHPEKQHLHLVLNNHLLNESINTAHNGNKIIPYYPLPNITDLLGRLCNCKVFSSLDLRSGYHDSGLTPEAKPKTSFATTSRKWHWNVAPFRSLPVILSYLMSQVLSGLYFWFTHLEDICIYSASWEEHLQHLETVFSHIQAANLKIKLSKCQIFKQHLHYLGHLIS